MVIAEPPGSFWDRALPGIWLSGNRATLQTVCGVWFSGCGYSVRYDLPTATTSFPKRHLRSTPSEGPPTTRRAVGGLDCGAPNAAPHHPLPGRRRSFLQGTSRVKGEPLRDAFFRPGWLEKSRRRRPAGRPAKQQPDAALEAACHLSRQWSLRGGGEGLVGGRDHLAQVAASETWSWAGSLREFTSYHWLKPNWRQNVG